MKYVPGMKRLFIMSIVALLLFVITLPVSGEMLKPMAGIQGPFAGGGWEYPTKPIKIAVWWHEYGPFTAYVHELIDRYQKLHPNVTIEAVVASQTDINQN